MVINKPISKILIILLIVSIVRTSFAEEASKEISKEKPQEISKKDNKITINLVDVDISTLVKFISEITGKNFIYDERLKGKITVIAPSKLSVDDAFNLFTSLLELKGFTIITTGNAYKIIPSAIARQSGTEIAKETEKIKVNETYIVRLIPLNFISSQDAIAFIQPLVSRDGYASAFGPGNFLLVVDNALNMEKILEILKGVDKESEQDESEIVYLKYAQAEAISKILKERGQRVRGGQRAGGAAQGQPPRSTEGKIIPDVRLNAIILICPSAEREDYKRIIAILDVPPTETSSRINVYYLENAEAAEISKVLEGLTRPQPPQPGVTSSQMVSEFSGRIAITPDKATNSLIIMSSPEDYQTLAQVIKKLDRRPRQVFVEAMITEVFIDKALDLGTKWRASAKNDRGEPVVIGGVGSVDSTEVQNIISGMAGLTVGGMGNFVTVPVTRADGSSYNLTAPGFAALFSLKQFRDAINVLSTPHILTSDNKEAEIIVGENVPFLSKFEREATTANQPILQSIERKDVGITLKIKPQISEGDYVKLDIYQEISAVAPTSQTGGQAKDIITTKRSAKTSVVVKNEQTIVIGGLIQDKEIKNVTKVPLLGDIPLLGWLFKYSSTQRQKINLIIYLTPTIIKDFSELDNLKEKTEEKFKGGVSEKEGQKAEHE
jgi:general secretion pathway protein D